jgi:hypothetical protein
MKDLAHDLCPPKMLRRPNWLSRRCSTVTKIGKAPVGSQKTDKDMSEDDQRIAAIRLSDLKHPTISVIAMEYR